MPAGLWSELAALRRYEPPCFEEACLEEDVPFLRCCEPLLGDPHWLRLIDGDGVHLNGAGISDSLSGCGSGRPCCVGRAWSRWGCTPIGPEGWRLPKRGGRRNPLLGDSALSGPLERA